MDVELIDERQVTAGLDESIRALLQVCFPKDREHYALDRGWHGSQPAFCAVGRLGGRVIAHLGVVDRTISVGGRPVRVFGPQCVAVAPEHRGRRLVDQVMAAALQEALRRGFQAGLLFCGPARQRVYARTGWQVLSDRPITRVDCDGLTKPLPPGHTAMAHGLEGRGLPPGPIHLNGNDW